MPMSSDRTRTFTWTDAGQLASARGDRSGLDFLTAITDGRLPQAPLMDTLDFSLVEVAEGHAVFEGAVAESHYNLIGSVHGGYAAAILDSAAGCAVFSSLGPGIQWTTLSLSVDYVRPLAAGLAVRATGTVIRAGHTIALATASLSDAAGKLYARSNTTCMVFR